MATASSLGVVGPYPFEHTHYGYAHYGYTYRAPYSPDRWNTTSFEHYWRLWNIPVHSWIARHVYFPCLRACASRGLRRGPSKQLAGAVCFFFSAVFHELVIGLPLRGVRVPLAFVAMMAQVPLISASGYLPRTEGTPFAALGNYVFWLAFCFLGQPLAVLLYFYQAQPPQC